MEWDARGVVRHAVARLTDAKHIAFVLLQIENGEETPENRSESAQIIRVLRSREQWRVDAEAVILSQLRKQCTTTTRTLQEQLRQSRRNTNVEERAANSAAATTVYKAWTGLLQEVTTTLLGIREIWDTELAQSPVFFGIHQPNAQTHHFPWDGSGLTAFVKGESDSVTLKQLAKQNTFAAGALPRANSTAVCSDQTSADALLKECWKEVKGMRARFDVILKIAIAHTVEKAEKHRLEQLNALLHFRIPVSVALADGHNRARLQRREIVHQDKADSATQDDAMVRAQSSRVLGAPANQQSDATKRGRLVESASVQLQSWYRRNAAQKQLLILKRQALLRHSGAARRLQRLWQAFSGGQTPDGKAALEMAQARAKSRLRQAMLGHRNLRRLRSIVGSAPPVATEVFKASVLHLRFVLRQFDVASKYTAQCWS